MSFYCRVIFLLRAHNRNKDASKYYKFEWMEKQIA